METVDCLLCHYPEYRKKWVRFGQQIVECPNCSLRWVNPRVSRAEIKDVYAGNYFQFRNSRQAGEDNPEESFKRENCKRHLRKIESYHFKGKLLDIGCAEGLFLRTAQDKGWEISGVEVSPQAAEIARRFLPGKISVGSVEDVQFPENYFDVISMLDVIEHLYDPINCLKKVHRLLKPGGIVYLLTPDCRSVFARVMGRYWFEIKPKEHLYYFSGRTLKILFEKSGFDTRAIEKTGKVLTLRYIARILEKEKSVLGGILRGLTGWTPFYNTDITFPAGFVLGVGLKK